MIFLPCHHYCACVVAIATVINIIIITNYLGAQDFALKYKNSSLASKWSPQFLIQSNITSTLLVPEFAWMNGAERYSPCPLHFFVYSNIPFNFSSYLEDKVMESNKEGSRPFENANLDLALIKLFRTSPCRTDFAQEANLFVVPYPHCSHCAFGGHGYQAGCRQVPIDEVNVVLNSLKYYRNESYKVKHLFLASWGTGMTLKKFDDEAPLILTVGPKQRQKNAVIVPMVNVRPEFQPSAEIAANWSFRPRKYIFSYFFGAMNKKMRGGGRSNRQWRVYFFDDINRNAEGNASLAGMPFLLHKFSDADPFDEEMVLNSYKDSIFCPVLPGDLCWQQRFYDVILAGCLPLVLEWTDPNRSESSRSWFQPSGCSIYDAYPFMKGQFGFRDDIEIDYDEFVVSVAAHANNEEDVSSLRITMDQLVGDTLKLQRMQLALRSAAQRLSYGLGEDAHQSNDAFANILRSLSYLLSHEGR